MKQSILVFSNTNVFSILTHQFLQEYTTRIVNVRYANEHLDREGQIMQMVKEMRLHTYYTKGIIGSKHDFVFNSRFAYRVQEALERDIPSFILFEMKTKKEAEWAALQYIQRQAPCSVVVYAPRTSPEEEKELLCSLVKIGVNEVITTLEPQIFQRLAKRYFANT